MNWISVKERLPKQEGMVLVLNTKGWMGPTRAIYYPTYSAFVHYDPQMHEKLLLEATHWMEIPDPPHE